MVTARSRPTLDYVASVGGWYQKTEKAACWRSFELPWISIPWVNYLYPGQSVRIVTKTAKEIVIQAPAPTFGFREVDYVNPRTHLQYRSILYQRMNHETYRADYAYKEGQVLRNGAGGETIAFRRPSEHGAECRVRWALIIQYDWWYDWSVSSDYAKVSVSLPVGLLERARDRVGSRGLSRYVAQAMEAQERREALREWLAGQDAEHGPIPEEIMQEVRNQWLGNADG